MGGKIQSEETSVTTLLHAWREGDRSALDRLVPRVYSELRRLAGSCMKNERTVQTLEPTALVHEAYLRLAGASDPDFTSRAHFLGIAARIMRQICWTGRAPGTPISATQALSFRLKKTSSRAGRKQALVVSLDDALVEMERQDPEKARILELKYFGGLTAEESAELLGLSVHRVNRQMRLAQAWLRRELETVSPAGGPPKSTPEKRADRA